MRRRSPRSATRARRSGDDDAFPLPRRRALASPAGRGGARLDAAGEARALAIAQASGQRRTDGARARRARRRARRGRAPSRSDPARADARSVHARRHGGGDGAARATRSSAGERVAIFGDYDVDGAASAALLSEYLEACGCETIDPHSRSRHRGLRPEQRGDGRLRRARAPSLVVTVDCGAVSHEPIAEARAARPRRRRLRPSPGAGAPARRARRRRSRTARTISPGSAISAPPASSTWASSRSTARCARRLLQRPRRARSHRRARSRRAGDGRRRRAARRPQPRLRRARPGGDAPAQARRASPPCSTPPAPTGRRAPITSAFSSARASTPAAASATPRSAQAADDARRRCRRARSPPSSTA